MSYTVEDEEKKDKNKKTIWTVILISIIFVGFGYIYIISKNTKSNPGPTAQTNISTTIKTQKEKGNRFPRDYYLNQKGNLVNINPFPSRGNSEAIVSRGDLPSNSVRRGDLPPNRKGNRIVPRRGNSEAIVRRGSSGGLSSSIGSDGPFKFYSFTDSNKNSIGSDTFYSATDKY